jgi:tetratricopeptide (TPR) repeat protein
MLRRRAVRARELDGDVRLMEEVVTVAEQWRRAVGVVEVFYREWRDRFPDDPRAHKGLIDFYVRTRLFRDNGPLILSAAGEMEQRFLTGHARAQNGDGGEIDPSEIAAYVAQCYVTVGYKEQAIESYRRAVKLSSGEVDNNVAMQLALLLEEVGQEDEAREWRRLAKKRDLQLSRSGEYAAFFGLLQRLQDQVVGSGRELVLLSSAFHSADVLRQGLDPHERVLFVDNFEVFEDAVEEAPIRTFFRDKQKPFKNTTEAGSRLIAEAIAKTLRADREGRPLE